MKNKQHEINNWDLKPGSDEARLKGCKCPVFDNCKGAGVVGSQGFKKGCVYIVNENCKLHSKIKKEVKND